MTSEANSFMPQQPYQWYPNNHPQLQNPQANVPMPTMLAQPLQMVPQLAVLKMTNIPSDLTPREAKSVFALVFDELATVELKDYSIYAYFKNYNTCVATAKLLDGKYIFGADYAPVKVDYDPGLNTAFNGLRISPQEDEDKRSSVQRSRFVFSDPFNEMPANPSIDLSDLSGKSLLLMESQNDAREYESLVRDHWTGGTSPGGNVDWGQPTDRRRTSSAFFNNPSAAANGSASSSNIASQNAQNPQNNPSVGQPNQSQSGQNIPVSAAPGTAAAAAAAAAANGANGAAQGPPTAAALQNVKSSTKQATTPKKESNSVADLSLLARVPPPANPADQNPPCNTLYVGNLPPDATEAELRALFSPQKGFRRLSFRTKNQTQSTGANGSTTTHNHGPMCFVEFEDVAHATRALAELYGRALPRPNGSNGKGGIRLSFSKNPLGVRGPGNPRRTSTNQVPGVSVGTVGNYGYSNYKQ